MPEDKPTPEEVCAAVREQMVAFGFPGTLMPACMVDGAIDERSGRFRVELAREVMLEIAGFPVRYATRITGVIQNGALTQMSGVKIKKGLWLGLSSIHASGDHLTFTVGALSKNIPRSEWDG